MGQVTKVWLSCYLVLLSNDSKTRQQDARPSWPDPYRVHFVSSMSDLCLTLFVVHYNDIVMSAMASQITSVTIVYSRFYSGTNHQRNHQSSTSLAALLALCVGNSLVTGEFPTQRASNTENVSILWCHNVLWCVRYCVIVDHVITRLDCTKPDWELNYSVISWLKCSCITASHLTSKWGIFREPGVMGWLWGIFCCSSFDVDLVPFDEIYS